MAGSAAGFNAEERPKATSYQVGSAASADWKEYKLSAYYYIRLSVLPHLQRAGSSQMLKRQPCGEMAEPPLAPVD